MRALAATCRRLYGRLNRVAEIRPRVTMGQPVDRGLSMNLMRSGPVKIRRQRNFRGEAKTLDWEPWND